MPENNEDKNAPLKTKRYAAIKTRFFIADIILSIVSIGAFFFLFSRTFSFFSYDNTPNFYAASLLYCGAFLIFLHIISFPLKIANSFYIEKRYDLSRQNLWQWLLDDGKSFILSFILSLICIEAFYFVLRGFPNFWWLIITALWMFFSIILTRLFPVIFIPLFYKYLPIDDDELKGRIVKLAEENNIPLVDVCRIDFSKKTSKANAALVGMGASRKVILADTLTDGFTHEEVMAVVAHEFGHFKYRHIWKLLAGSTLVTMLAFFLLNVFGQKIVSMTGATGLSDLYLFPVLMLLLVGFSMVIMPLQNLLSRVLEKEADSFTLDVTGKPDVFIAMMEKLAEKNLSDKDPSLLKKIFMCDHPPISERIEMAEEFKRLKN